MKKILILALSLLLTVTAVSIVAPSVEAEETFYVSNGAEQIPDIYKIQMGAFQGQPHSREGLLVVVELFGVADMEERLRNKENMYLWSPWNDHSETGKVIYYFDYVKNGLPSMMIGDEEVHIKENQLFMRSTIVSHHFEAGQGINIQIDDEDNNDGLRFGIPGSSKFTHIVNADSTIVIKESGENMFYGTYAGYHYSPMIFVSYSITLTEASPNIMPYGYVCLILGIAVFAIFTFFGVKRKMEDQ